MKTFVWLISNHGFGHMTRCLSVLEELIKLNSYHHVLVSGLKHNKFAMQYLNQYLSQLEFINFDTDIGFVNHKDSLVVDREALTMKLCDFITNSVDKVNALISKVENKNVGLIVSDISPLGSHLGRKLAVPCVGLSNFTWVEQYRNLELDNELVDYFESAYKDFDFLIEYGLPLPMEYFECKKHSIAFLSRQFNLHKVNDLKERYRSSVLITCGRSAGLEPIRVKNYEGCLLHTQGVYVDYMGRVESIDLDTLDTHHYIAASDFIIAKAGWGTVAEALIAGVPLVLIERPSAYEDTHINQELKKQRLAISIKEEDLSEIDVGQLTLRLDSEIDFERLHTFENHAKQVAKLLLEYDTNRRKA